MGRKEEETRGRVGIQGAESTKLRYCQQQARISHRIDPTKLNEQKKHPRLLYIHLSPRMSALPTKSPPLTGRGKEDADASSVKVDSVADTLCWLL